MLTTCHKNILFTQVKTTIYETSTTYGTQRMTEGRWEQVFRHVLRSCRKARYVLIQQKIISDNKEFYWFYYIGKYVIGSKFFHCKDKIIQFFFGMLII